MEELRKELRIARIMNGILAVLLCCVLAVGIFVGVQIHKGTEALRPVAEKVAAADFELLNETMSSLNATLQEIDWEKLSLQLEELDMDALNEAIAGLDTEELSTALENLNKAIETMNSFGDSFRNFFAK